MKMIMKMKMNGRMRIMRKVSEEIIAKLKDNSWKSNNTLERFSEKKMRDVEGYMTFDNVEERDYVYDYLFTVADKLGLEVEKREDVEGDPEEDEEIGRGIIVKFGTSHRTVGNDAMEILNMIDNALGYWPEDWDFDFTGYEYDI